MKHGRGGNWQLLPYVLKLILFRTIRQALKHYLCPSIKTPGRMNFNPDKQHTLKEAVSISGPGLHTGIMADLTLKPASPGFGFQFQRIDLPNQPIIKADCDLV